MPSTERCPNPACDGLLSDEGHERTRFMGLPVVACPEMPEGGFLVVNPLREEDVDAESR